MPRSASLGLRCGVAAAAGAVGSPVGHLLVYWIRLGPASMATQSTGSHAYFPSLAAGAASVGGGAALGALAVVAAARLMVGLRNGRVPLGGWPLAPLVGTAFASALLCFAVQEALEAGGRPDGGVLAIGVPAQLAIATVVALLLRWLSARVPAAVRALAAGPAPAASAPPVSALASLPVWALARVPADTGLRLQPRRGPPLPIHTVR